MSPKKRKDPSLAELKARFKQSEKTIKALNKRQSELKKLLHKIEVRISN